MNLVTHLLELPLVYRLWQAPFAEDKLAPLLEHNDLRQVRRVLDVGCGPGTNTPLFTHADYLGIDINERYIERARRRYKRTFVAADLTTLDYAVARGKFDFILINSLLHHIKDIDCHTILSQLSARLSEGGCVHILELVLPGGYSVAQLLANCDRGKYPRPLNNWRALFIEHFEIIVFQPYSLGLLGTTLWNMIYCKGRAKR
jgi:SAM-dependent methyltransferase